MEWNGINISHLSINQTKFSNEVRARYLIVFPYHFFLFACFSAFVYLHLASLRFAPPHYCRYLPTKWMRRAHLLSAQIAHHGIMAQRSEFQTKPASTMFHYNEGLPCMPFASYALQIRFNYNHQYLYRRPRLAWSPLAFVWNDSKPVLFRDREVILFNKKKWKGECIVGQH